MEQNLNVDRKPDLLAGNVLNSRQVCTVKMHVGSTSTSTLTFSQTSLKFSVFIISDLRPGKIIRECDHVYEKLFGYHTMNTKQEDGCYPFSTDVNGKPESGVYCMCSTELCNEGTIVWPPTSSSSSDV